MLLKYNTTKKTSTFLNALGSPKNSAFPRLISPQHWSYTLKILAILKSQRCCLVQINAGTHYKATAIVIILHMNCFCYINGPKSISCFGIDNVLLSALKIVFRCCLQRVQTKQRGFITLFTRCSFIVKYSFSACGCVIVGSNIKIM